MKQTLLNYAKLLKQVFALHGTSGSLGSLENRLTERRNEEKLVAPIIYFCLIHGSWYVRFIRKIRFIRKSGK